MISPNVAGYSGNLYQTMGHELIHAFHYYTGAIRTFGSGGSDYIAYRWNASQATYPSGYMLQMNQYMTPIYRNDMLPPWADQNRYWNLLKR